MTQVVGAGPGFQTLAHFGDSVTGSAVRLLGQADQLRFEGVLLRGRPSTRSGFALDDDVWLNILALPRGSPSDTPDLAECLHLTLGEIDIGPPGLAAINFLLENLIQGHSWSQSLLLLGLVESMLANISAWRAADHR